MGVGRARRRCNWSNIKDNRSTCKCPYDGYSNVKWFEKAGTPFDIQTAAFATLQEYSPAGGEQEMQRMQGDLTDRPSHLVSSKGIRIWFQYFALLYNILYLGSSINFVKWNAILVCQMKMEIMVDTDILRMAVLRHYLLPLTTFSQ